jgi:hypothetical protein
MTRYAVITFVTDAIGRSVSGAFDHSTCPLLASTRIPDGAFTPDGAPVTVSDGDGLGVGDAEAL